MSIPLIKRQIKVQRPELLDTDLIITMLSCEAARGKSTKYLSIIGNTTYSQRQLSDESAIQISDCSDVKVEKNRYLPLSEWVNKPYDIFDSG